MDDLRYELSIESLNLGLLSLPRLHRPPEEVVVFESEASEKVFDAFEVVVEEPVVCGWDEADWV